jgi:cysteine desulfurase
MKMSSTIYLDHNATTPLDPEVALAMQPCLIDNCCFGNPTRAHWAGIPAKNAIQQAKLHVSHLINASTSEIVFTSGASESVNHAIKGVVFSYLPFSGKKEVVTSCIEHPSASASCQFLANTLNIKISEIPVDEFGIIDLEYAADVISENTALVNIILANHETGSIQPVKELIKIAHSHGVIVHVDATCAMGKLTVDVKDLDCDLLSFSAHKFYGPKGIGVLFIRESLHHGLPGVNPRPELIPLIHGSAPSSAFRSGTPNLPFIIGMGKACEIAHEWNSEINRNLLAEKTQLFWNLMTETFGDNVILNGHSDPARRVCNTLNVSFAGTEGEQLLAKLDQVAASSGAKTEYILNQLGKPADIARGGIRFSLGKSTTTDQITETVELIEQALTKPNRQKINKLS